MKTTADASHASPGPAPRFLLVTSASGLSVVALPRSGNVVLGREPDCDVVLPHSKVSRQHARLRLGEPTTLADLGSRNGTFLRGAQLEGEQPIGAGDSFTIGGFTLLLLAGGAGASPRPGSASLRVEDPAAAEAEGLIGAIARAPVSVILRGETGAGKEVLARALHRASGRSGPFLGVNCAAFSESLLESELFGHEKGAFTGAVGRAGLLESTAGGTLLLDEIGEMDPGLQAKLLRAIEAREILRVGGMKPVAIDVRFIAASHRDLFTSEDFRRDLYYRLAGVTLEIPPLRERRERIGALAVQLLADRAVISAEATAFLTRHDWPGNVRELRNVLDRALLLAQGREIRAEHIVFDQPLGEPHPSAPETDERARILAALEACAGNQTRAARRLGIARATLVRKLAVLGIPRPRR